MVCYYAYSANRPVPNRSCTRCFRIIVPPSIPQFDPSRTTTALAFQTAVHCRTRIRLVANDAGGAGYCASVVAVVPEGGSRPLPPFATFGAVGSAAPTGQTFGCNNGSEYEFVWLPRRGQEGATYTVCFEVIGHLQPHVAAARRCVTISVQKCAFCAAQGDTVYSMAQEFGTDWIQLWGANPTLTTPHALPEGLMLNVGPGYDFKRGDSVNDVARRFGTTPQAILNLNPDLKSLDDVREGSHLCLTPAVCA